MNTITHSPELVIKPPYDNWDPERISIGYPNYCNGVTTPDDTPKPHHKCFILYDHGLNGTSHKSTLVIEFPENIGICFCEIPVLFDISNLVMTNESCGRIMCQLNTKCELVEKLYKIINDIYDICLTYMECQGRNGTEIFNR